MGERIEVLSDGTVLIEYGPMQMFIQAFEHGRPEVELSREGARKAKDVLEDLARFLPLIKRKAQALETKGDYPDVVQRMIAATRVMEEPDLTPLAAVAGAASDVVADFMLRRGGTKIIVDNGGDIAVRIREGEIVRVGVKTDIRDVHPSYVLSLDEAMRIGGVATSGLGGRSFTKGVASAATVLAETCSFADAAATVIGNFTDTEDPCIQRSLAERIYPDTDLAGEWVTTKVGPLPQEKREEALHRGLAKAESLGRKGLIKGALVAVKGGVAWTGSMGAWLTGL